MKTNDVELQNMIDAAVKRVMAASDSAPPPASKPAAARDTCAITVGKDERDRFVSAMFGAGSNVSRNSTSMLLTNILDALAGFAEETNKRSKHRTPDDNEVGRTIRGLRLKGIGYKEIALRSGVVEDDVQRIANGSGTGTHQYELVRNAVINIKREVAA